jgi:hypothetical protein
MFLAAGVAMFLFPRAALAQVGTPDLEILSKADARSIFAMTRSEWTENVRQAVMAGAATAMGDPESGATLATTNPTGYFFVKPNYSGKGRPDFVQATVGYRSPTAELLSDNMLNDVIDYATRQMEPEYKVVGRIERLEGAVVAIFFIITEKEQH